MRLFATFLFVNICILSNDVLSQLPGNYSRKGKDFTYRLNLNSDSTFNFHQTYFESDSKCVGKWHIISNNTILLKCAEGSLPEQLQSGYMSQRDIYGLIINKRKIRVGNEKLRKQ